MGCRLHISDLRDVYGLRAEAIVRGTYVTILGWVQLDLETEWESRVSYATSIWSNASKLSYALNGT